MSWRFKRTQMLLGNDSMNKLSLSKVAVFGVGGVGGHAAEALVRSGIGEITLVDSDRVDITNLNRQIIALDSTVGEYKVDAAEKRFKDINPTLTVKTYKLFVLPENLDQIDISGYDYIVDAIDTVSAKIALVQKARELGIRIISSMGTGNKMNPCMLEVSDIKKTSVCPLARVMRQELKKRGIDRLKVVYSKEEPIMQLIETEASPEQKKRPPASNSFVPATAGLIIASEVVKDIINFDKA